MAKHLLLFSTVQVDGVLAADEEVWDTDPEQQADLLMTLLARGLPARTVRIFCKKSGASYEKIVNIDEPEHMRHGRLTKEEVRKIRSSQGKRSAVDLALKFGVDKSTIRQIWERKTWAWLD